MARTTRVPFWINPGDGLVIPNKDKIKGEKPSMAGMACPVFGVGTPESTGDSIISSITTKVKGASVPSLEESYKDALVSTYLSLSLIY